VYLGSGDFDLLVRVVFTPQDQRVSQLTMVLGCPADILPQLATVRQNPAGQSQNSQQQLYLRVLSMSATRLK